MKVQIRKQGEGPTVADITESNWVTIKTNLHERFYLDEEVARFEETKYENGATGMSLKNRGNVIIIGYKTIVE